MTNEYTLQQYAAVLGLRSGSPFCVKTEILLRMAGADYRSLVIDNPSKTPKKKLPVVVYDGEMLADSEFIRMHLEKAFDVDFDEGLSPESRAIADGFKKLCEEHLYWVIFYSRWAEPENWPVLREAYFGAIPKLLRGPIASMIKKGAMKSMWGQGMGRHSRDELYLLGERDLQSLADFLGDKTFFMGDKVSSVDATVFPFVSSILNCTLDSPLKESARGHANLVSYNDRMHAHFFLNAQEQAA